MSVWRAQKLSRALVALLAAGSFVGGVTASRSVASADPDPGVPVVADAQSAPDSTTAHEIAFAYKHPVLDESSVDAYSETTVNADGSSTAETSATPVRMMTATGWTPIDLSLQTQSDGSLAPTQSPSPVTFGSAGSTQLASLSNSGATVGYDWTGPLPAPEIDGATATYHEVEPGVDLVVSATLSGFEASVVYKTAAAAEVSDSVTLPMEMSGVHPVTQPDGDVSYVSPAGAEVASTPQPQAWDASAGGSATAPSLDGTTDVDATVTSAATTMQIPQTILDDPTTVYPVVVDPGVLCTGCGEVDHGYVENDGANEMDNNWDSGHVHVGTWDSGQPLARGLYSFNQGSSHGQSIVSATLKLTEVDQWSYASTSVPMTIYQSAYFDSGATWSPGLSTTNAVTVSGGCGHENTCAYPNIDVTGIATYFASTTSGRYYFQLRAGTTSSGETTPQNWHEFAASATLDVTYHSVPVAFNNDSVTPCWVRCSQTVYTRSSTPTVEGQATTADGELLDYYYEYARSTSPTATPGRSEKVANVGSGHDYFHITASSLGADGDFEYRLRACDAGTTVCDTSNWYLFTVDTSAPSAPNVANGSFHVDGTKAGFTYDLGNVLADPNGSTDTYAYAFSQTQGAIGSATDCGTTGSVTTVCNVSQTDPRALVFAPQSMTTTLQIAAFDLAGNKSPTVTETILVNNQLAGQPYHAWIGSDPPTSPTSIADTPGALHPTALTLSSFGTTIVTGSAAPPSHAAALTFSGSFDPGQTAAVPSAATTDATVSTGGGAVTPLVVGPTDSMTVAAWVNPAVVNDGKYHTAVAMDGSVYSQFYLQEHGGAWRFCMPHDQVAGAGNDCVSSTSTGPDAPHVGQWQLLIAVWDPSNDQMRLSVYLPSTTSFATTSATHSTAATSQTGAITVGRAVPASTKDPNLWNLFPGSVSDVLVYRHVLDASQFQVLGDNYVPPPGS